jgi:membrane protein DedA with SNARE-associated domain
MPINDPLQWITAYGPAAMVALLVMARVGLPSTATLVLIAAGGLARQGVVDTATVIVCAIGGLLLGDVLGYVLGRQSVARLLARAPGGLMVRARLALERFGGTAIFLSRFLLLPLAVPVNYLAAATGARLPRFLLLAVIGDLLFLLLFFGTGYLFSGNWDAILAAIRARPLWQWALLVVALGLAGMLWTRFERKRIRRRQADLVCDETNQAC